MVDYFFAGGPIKEVENLIESEGYCRLFSYFNELNYLNKVRFTKNSIKGKLFVDSVELLQLGQKEFVWM